MVRRALAVGVFGLALASAEAVCSRELIHPYLPTGPIEVAGAPAANKALRAVQHYAMPAFTDVLATHVANSLSGASDEPITVVRKARQGGREALDAVAKSAPDGRTLLLALNAPALTGIARVAVMPYVIVVRSDSSLTDTADLISRTQASSARLLAASAGERTVSHAALAMLRSQYKVHIEPVSYKGGYAALQALVTGEVSAALVPLPSVMPYMAGGRLRVLPTEKSALIEVNDAFHVFAPPGTPNIVIARLNTAMAETLVTKDAQELFLSLGVRLDYRSAGARSR